MKICLLFLAVVCALLQAYLVYGALKKGVNIWQHGWNAHHCDELDLLNYDYWADWRADLTHYNTSGHPCVETIWEHKAKHIPMFWGNYDYTIDVPGADYILGFNEPNDPDQSDLTPSEAAAAWAISMEPYSDNYTLVGPSPKRCRVGCTHNYTQWMDDFEDACNGSCTYTYVNAHWYGACKASIMMEYLQMIYDRYNKSIILSEFACPTTTDQAKVNTFMNESLQLMDESGFVVMAFWYKARIFANESVEDTNSIFEPLDGTNPSVLATIGEYFNAYVST